MVLVLSEYESGCRIGALPFLEGEEDAERLDELELREGPGMALKEAPWSRLSVCEWSDAALARPDLDTVADIGGRSS
jgi:hypothetical protein